MNADHATQTTGGAGGKLMHGRVFIDIDEANLLFDVFGEECGFDGSYCV